MDGVEPSTARSGRPTVVRRGRSVSDRSPLAGLSARSPSDVLVPSVSWVGRPSSVVVMVAAFRNLLCGRLRCGGGVVGQRASHLPSSSCGGAGEGPGPVPESPRFRLDPGFGRRRLPGLPEPYSRRSTGTDGSRESAGRTPRAVPTRIPGIPAGEGGRDGGGRRRDHHRRHPGRQLQPGHRSTRPCLPRAAPPCRGSHPRNRPHRSHLWTARRPGRCRPYPRTVRRDRPDRPYAALGPGRSAAAHR